MPYITLQAVQIHMYKFLIILIPSLCFTDQFCQFLRIVSGQEIMKVPERLVCCFLQHSWWGPEACNSRQADTRLPHRLCTHQLVLGQSGIHCYATSTSMIFSKCCPCLGIHCYCHTASPRAVIVLGCTHSQLIFLLLVLVTVCASTLHSYYVISLTPPTCCQCGGSSLRQPQTPHYPSASSPSSPSSSSCLALVCGLGTKGWQVTSSLFRLLQHRQGDGQVTFVLLKYYQFMLSTTLNTC